MNNNSIIGQPINILFLGFIFLVLTFGRFFSILHIGPIYVTEIMLFFALILLFQNFKKILEIPKIFLRSLTVFFVLTNIYLIYGIYTNNLYALRDIVLSGYLIFLTTTFIVLSSEGKLKVFLWIIVLSNIIGLVINRLWIYQPYPWYPFMVFSSIIKIFNYAFYYAFSLSFLIALLDLPMDKKKKGLTILLCLFNIYMIIMIGVRASWLATFFMLLFMVLIFRRKIFKYLIYVIILACLASAVFFYMPKLSPLNHPILKDKVNSFSLFFMGKEKKENPQGERINECYDNITWRLRIWANALNTAAIKPFSGNGFGTTRFLKKDVKNPLEPKANILPLHNHIITIFYKTGILSLILFTFLNVYAFLFGLLYLKYCKSKFLKCFLIGALGGFIQWHGMALFFDMIDSPPTSIFLWIIIGLIFAAVNIDKRQLINNE